MAYLFALAKKGDIPDIYLQDEKYFKDAIEEVKELYSFGIGKIDKVSLHVRRGDYINNPFYVNLGETDYYDKAMAEFPGAEFMVFCKDRQEGSDDDADMAWCKERFKGDQFTFWDGQDEVTDMNIMASCTGHIMANSSFSWWAAYLGGGKTVAPKNWFADDVERIKLLDAWIKL